MNEKQTVLPALLVNAADRAVAGRTKRRAERMVAEDLACRERQFRALLQSLIDAGIGAVDGKVLRPQCDNDFLYAAEYAGVPFDRAAAVAVALAHRGWRTPLTPPSDSTKEAR